MELCLWNIFQSLLSTGRSVICKSDLDYRNKPKRIIPNPPEFKEVDFTYYEL